MAVIAIERKRCDRKETTILIFGVWLRGRNSCRDPLSSR